MRTVRLIPLLVALILAFFSHTIYTFPYPINHDFLWDDQVSALFNSSHVHSRQVPDIEWLRILPLGASIVRGVGSDPKDGFRKPLRDRLRERGYQVNMIGSQKNDFDDPRGSMRNGAHEGHSGAIISEVREYLEDSIDRLPNVVLINAGTNDAADPENDIGNAHNRLGEIVDRIFEVSNRATVILSTLLPNAGNSGANDRVNLVNRNIRNMIRQRREEGQRILLAEMNDGRFITFADVSGDGIHPDNEGFRKMAAVWDAAIKYAADEGMLQDPEDNGTPDDQPLNDCPKIPGEGEGPVQIQRGSGYDDGPYRHKSTDMGIIWSVEVDFVNSVVRSFSFAQLVVALGNTDPAGAIDEIVLYVDKEQSYDGRIYVTMFTNLADGNFDEGRRINVDDPRGCGTDGVRWGDVNNDGLDDFICLGFDGSLYVSLNRGDQDGTPRFEHVGLYRQAPPGYKLEHVRLGDIDGDGRLDYCLTHERDGNVHCWRNGGQGDMAEYWQDLGVVFEAIGMGDIRGTRLVDVSGDFRSDWVWVGDKGETTIFTNMRGVYKGLTPHWLKAEVAHAGMGVEGVRNRIKFGRVYGSGRRDYGYITSTPLGGDEYRHDLRVYRNEASGGTRMKSDGNRYCDMTGDGREDYIWILSTGEMTMYRNIGDPPNWGQDGVIIDIQRDRKSVHLADWTGDGKCDILAVERYTGRVEMWENTYSGEGQVTFNYYGWLDGMECKEGWGVGIFDLGLRFADISGDGKADYLCMEKDGRTSGYVNNWPDGVDDVGQIKFSVGRDRANHRWADVNGDGRADFIWADKFDGSTEVYYNEGRVPDEDVPNNSGSSFKWAFQGKLYNGVDRGANQYYVDVDGNGRADIVRVDPTNNFAEVWYNKCPNTGGGADDPSSDPDLPAYERPDDTTDPPFQWPITFPNKSKWFALGDSYSAGVGAGTPLNNPRDPDTLCLTTQGSYPAQLGQSVDNLRDRLDFLSCTGDLIAGVNQAGTHGRPPQIELMAESNQDEYSVATLSIGGNDLNFANIVITCILIGDNPFMDQTCEQYLVEAEATVQDGTTENSVMRYNLREVYKNVLDTAGDEFTLVVTGYAAFFSTDNEDCNSGTLAIVLDKVGNTPRLPLTLALRSRINNGVRNFNRMINDAVLDIQRELDSSGTRKRIRFVDVDPIYEGHRFCEPGFRGSGSVDEQPWPEYSGASWFFTPYSSDIDTDGNQLEPRDSEDPNKPRLDRRDPEFCNDPTSQWECMLGYLRDTYSSDQVNIKHYPRGLLDILPETTRAGIMKSFHPKTVAYNAIADRIQHAWEKWTNEPAGDGVLENAICSPGKCSSEGCSMPSSMTRRDLDLDLAVGTFNSSLMSRNDEHSALIPRGFTYSPTTDREVRDHIDSQSSRPGFMSNAPTGNGDPLSGRTVCRQQKFASATLNENGQWLAGPGTTLLYGCTILTVVSRRGVYTCHIWEDVHYLAEPSTPPGRTIEGFDPVLALISGLDLAPEWQVGGDSLDPALFYGETGDNPQAFIMTPRPRSKVLLEYGPDDQLYPTERDRLVDRLQLLIPPILIRQDYNYEADQRSIGLFFENGQPVRRSVYFYLDQGKMLFEYDRSNNNGRPEWRLWYERHPFTGPAT